MKKILSVFMICMFLGITSVAAVNTTAGSDTINGSDKRVLAQETRATIIANRAELKELRVQLKLKISETKKALVQYRLQEKLSEGDCEQIRSQLAAVKYARETLGNEYGNIVRLIASYKKDSSDYKLTGLEAVIDSQNDRIDALKTTIAKF